MTVARRPRRLTHVALALGIAVPFVYYGIQAVAWQFFPDFSLVRTTASELGSDLSRRPAVFNAGIMAMGAATLIASFGFLAALRRTGVNLVLSCSCGPRSRPTACRRSGPATTRCPTRATAATPRSSSP